MSSQNNTLNQETLKKFIQYIPETGQFFRIDTVRGWGYTGEIKPKPNKHGYLRANVCGKLYYLHRLAWLYVYGELPNLFIDHINRNKADNRIENLRIVDAIGNGQNQDVLGISWHKSNKRWIAQITVNKTHMNLGSFKNKNDAIAAYKAAKLKLHDFSVNF